MRIVGEKVCLRDRRFEDLEDIRQWFAPGQAWHQWDAAWETREWSEERELRMMERIAEYAAKPDEPRTSLEIETRDGSHIGWVNSYWVGRAGNWRDCGILIADESIWDRGLGREAFTLWTDYLMRVHELPRIGMGTWARNRRMIWVAARVGMHEEAHFASAREVEGRRYCAVRWGMTRAEWERHACAEPGDGLRGFVRDDWTAVCGLIRELYNVHRTLQGGPEFMAEEARDTLFAWRARRKNRLWVWQEDGRVVGLARARCDGVTFMEELVVAEDMRGKGLGTKMLRGIEEQLREEGETDIFLSMVWPGNLRALDLYRRLGYDLINTIELRKGLDEDRRGQPTRFLGRSFHLGKSVPPIEAE